MIDKPEDCPLCKGTNYRVLGGPDELDVPYWTRCDHTYLSYRGKVIATGNGATFLLGAIMAAPICIVITLIAVFTS